MRALTSKQPQVIRLSTYTRSLHDVFEGGNLLEVKKNLDEILLDAQVMWPQENLTEENIKFDVETEYGYYGASDHDVIQITLERLETEEEVKERLAKSKAPSAKARATAAKKKAADAIKKEQEELAEYERLKEKFATKA